MTTQDQACFEVWLEKFATDEERTLSYEKQVESHIMWLAGFDDGLNFLEQIPVTELGGKH